MGQVNNKKLIAVIIVVMLVVGMGAFVIINSMLDKPEDEEVPVVVEPTGETDIKEATSIIAPLTGLSVVEELIRRPLAVTIGNSPQERPQSGLKEADVVYELLAEGGITRFLAVYQQGNAENVGPIRSARDYLAYLAHNFDGVFVHNGGSPGGLAYVEQPSVVNLDAFYIASGEFWRTKDRIAPFNLYSKTSEMRKLMEKRGLDQKTSLELWLFSKPGEEFPGGRASEYLKIYYPQAYSLVEYRHEPDLNLYARFMGGKPHLDRESGLQLSARNIIIQYADTKVIDGEGRLDIAVVGSGKALIFTGGKVYDAVWKKADKRSPTVFTNAQGEKIPLTPGQTWIQLVRTGTQIDY